MKFIRQDFFFWTKVRGRCNIASTENSHSVWLNDENCQTRFNVKSHDGSVGNYTNEGWIPKVTERQIRHARSFSMLSTFFCEEYNEGNQYDKSGRIWPEQPRLGSAVKKTYFQIPCLEKDFHPQRSFLIWQNGSVSHQRHFLLLVQIWLSLCK